MSGRPPPRSPDRWTWETDDGADVVMLMTKLKIGQFQKKKTPKKNPQKKTDRNGSLFSWLGVWYVWVGGEIQTARGHLFPYTVGTSMLQYVHK